jgi:DUF1365 family protein
MERIDATEGTVTRFGPFSIAWVHSRDGRVVALVNTGFGETEKDLLRAGRTLKTRIDRDIQKDKNNG